ncbi:uncharacterized protein B0H18DRAFT_886960, partial [Fomitopsis serialis]|uniref:uncharacterized protein n=1 Tax=Fomitopsis serialis TaxID=139415 RepID=UPI0020082581
PHASGGCADIYRGRWKRQVVGIKALRLSVVSLLYAKEATIWRRLAHPNITPFYGIDTEHFKISMVYKWMAHGISSSFWAQFEKPAAHIW